MHRSSFICLFTEIIKENWILVLPFLILKVGGVMLHFFGRGILHVWTWCVAKGTWIQWSIYILPAASLLKSICTQRGSQLSLSQHPPLYASSPSPQMKSTLNLAQSKPFKAIATTQEQSHPPNRMRGLVSDTLLMQVPKTKRKQNQAMSCYMTSSRRDTPV